MSKVVVIIDSEGIYPYNRKNAIDATQEQFAEMMDALAENVDYSGGEWTIEKYAGGRMMWDTSIRGETLARSSFKAIQMKQGELLFLKNPVGEITEVRPLSDAERKLRSYAIKHGF